MTRQWSVSSQMGYTERTEDSRGLCRPVSVELPPDQCRENQRTGGGFPQTKALHPDTGEHQGYEYRDGDK